MVIKHTRKKRVGEITRTVARGTHEKAKKLLAATKGWTEFNTAFLERVNGTFRERLASFTRTCRYADAHIPRVAQRDAHVAEAASQNRSLLVLV
jgi:hypothetical protein